MRTVDLFQDIINASGCFDWCQALGLWVATCLFHAMDPLSVTASVFGIASLMIVDWEHQQDPQVHACS